VKWNPCRSIFHFDPAAVKIEVPNPYGDVFRQKPAAFIGVHLCIAPVIPLIPIVPAIVFRQDGRALVPRCGMNELSGFRPLR
jgi:hypothetical protein